VHFVSDAAAVGDDDAMTRGVSRLPFSQLAFLGIWRCIKIGIQYKHADRVSRWKQLKQSAINQTCMLIKKLHSMVKSKSDWVWHILCQTCVLCQLSEVSLALPL
jgi:hypothetical protein